MYTKIVQKSLGLLQVGAHNLSFRIAALKRFTRPKAISKRYSVRALIVEATLPDCLIGGIVRG